MAVNDIRAQFENLASEPASPARSRSQDHEQRGKISKKTIKQINKTIGSGNTPIIPGRPAKPKPPVPPMEQKPRSKSQINGDPSAASTLADVLKQSNRKSLSHSGEFSLSASSEGEASEETLKVSLPIRYRSHSRKEREEKSASTPFPASSDSESLKPVVHPKPAVSPKPPIKHPKPNVSPKPQVSNKPSIAPKPTVAPKPLPPKPRPKSFSPKKGDEIDGGLAISQQPNTTIKPKEKKPKESTAPVKEYHLEVGHDSTSDEDDKPDNIKANISSKSLVEELVVMESLRLSAALESAPADPFSPLSPGDVTLELHSPTETHPPLADTPSSPQLNVVMKRRTTDSGYQEGGEESDKCKTPDIVWDEAKREKAAKKRHNIALELLETEKTYVGRLKCIAEDFKQSVQALNVKGKVVIPEAVISCIFLNIGEIYTLHIQLLKDLESRMEHWEEIEQIGDIMSTTAPYLKLYSVYTARFEDAIKKLTEWTSKEKKLDVAVKEFEKQLGTGLGVAHYMLEPVQRIPRYKLLLADYLKNLPEDSMERPSAGKALSIIAEAADKTNNRIKDLENSNEILSIQRSIIDYEGTLLQPHRKILKKGFLMKLSRKNQTPRMFFLFSDILFHTVPSGPVSFKFKNELPLYGMRVEVPKVSLVPHSFEVLSIQRSLILSASSEEERTEWVTSLLRAINDETEKTKSLKREKMIVPGTMERAGFAVTAPIMVPDQSVSMCQICSREFTFTFRRHHCRACGRVVCGNCSPFKAYLPYMKKEERICGKCNSMKTAQNGEDVDGSEVEVQLREQPINRPDVPSLLVVDPEEKERESLMEAYVTEQDGKKSNRFWYVVRKDLALYKLRAHEDIRAIDTFPLPGYQITSDEASCVISLTHHSGKKKLNLTFKPDVEDFQKWVYVLEKASKLEIPEQVPPQLPSSSEIRLVRTRSRSLNCLLDSKDDQDISL